MNIRVNVDRRRRASRIALLAGMGLGSFAAYMLDPDRGKRRRALVRDRAVHAVHATGDVAEKAGRDLAHRAGGFVANLRAGRARPIDDVLVARVRSELGRAVSHPHAIDVLAEDGRVRLRGVVLAQELPSLLARVRRVRGVSELVPELEAHETADVPALQGGIPRTGARAEIFQQSWTPSIRIAAGALGGILSLYGLGRRRELRGLLATGLGASLLARSITNLPTSRLIGVGAGPRAVDVHKTIHVRAPIDDVFAFWTDFEAFPRIFEHVKDVRLVGDGRTRWTVAGPAGIPVHFDAEITRLEPGRILAWRTVGRGPIQHAGVLHFEPDANGGTRIDVQMTYNPAAGALGHFIASLFRVDPKHAMDDDLVRLKSLVEIGKTRAHGERVEREEIAAHEAERAMH